MSYQKPPPGPKHAFSSSSDPFNPQNGQVNQLNYDPNQPANPYAQGGATPGGPGTTPATQGGQYAPYDDSDGAMGARYHGGGMGMETWHSESGWSGNGVYLFTRSAGSPLGGCACRVEY